MFHEVLELSVGKVQTQPKQKLPPSFAGYPLLPLRDSCIIKKIPIEYLNWVELLVHKQHLLDALVHVFTCPHRLEIMKHLVTQLLLTKHLMSFSVL